MSPLPRFLAHLAPVAIDAVPGGEPPDARAPLEPDDRVATPDFDVAAGEMDHPELAYWRANVGAPLAMDLAPPAARHLAGIDVLSWNLAIGEARLDEVLARLREGEWGGAGTDPERPLVILAQEAYRADHTIPPAPRGSYHGGYIRARARRYGIAEVAEDHGLSLRYVASMRNGVERSDRGNAVLATCTLGRAHAFSLPYVRQHRVAVAAELAAVPGLAFVSAHLDTGGQLRTAPRRLARFGAGRAAQAAELARRVMAADAQGGVVLGGDLNTPLGMRDPALLSLVRAGLVPATRVGGWGHTFHGLGVRFHLDHVLYYSAHGRIRSVEVVRLDESPRDSPRPFGSDHHPLLARVTLACGAS